MINEVCVREFENEDMIAVLFDGDAEDIRELRDYARVINSVKQEAEDEYYRGFGNNDNLNNLSDIINDILNDSVVLVEDIEYEKDGELCNIITEIMEEEEEDLINHPSHYTNSGMECILEMVMLYGFEETMSFCKLNCHKYRKRALDKGGRMDMDKSNWYINTYKELSIALETGATPIQYVLNKMN